MSADGAQHHFLVMEPVEGPTLRTLAAELGCRETVREDGLELPGSRGAPEDLCRHIGREVARGLAAIHATGAVHRDLEPENVLVTKDHAVQVMDLGVARLADESLRLSQSGAFVGSVAYAAPEQYRGADVDARADLHELGVVLYELATGVHPFHGDDFRQVMRRVLDETFSLAAREDRDGILRNVRLHREIAEAARAAGY